MIALATSPQERERLAALRALHILDTPPEERFDRLTRLATHLFGVPMAFISLVDENRLWFKSRQGFPLQQRQPCRHRHSTGRHVDP